MIAAIKKYFSAPECARRRVSRRRATLRRKLEHVWAVRDDLDKQERDLQAMLGTLNLRELNDSIPTRAARGW